MSHLRRASLTIAASLTLAGGFGQWQSVGGGLDNVVRCFEYSVDSTKLLMGGEFVYTIVDHIRANTLIAWDGTSWITEGLGNGSGDTAAITSIEPPLLNLAYFRDTLFAATGAVLWHYEPAMALGAYLVDDQWYPLGSPENWFFVMKAHGRLFAGGRADTLYGTYMPGPKEWVGGAWHALPNTPFGTLGTIYDITWWKNNYYFSGSIAAGGALGVIRFDGVDQWSALGEGVGGLWVSHVVGFGDSLYAGGFFQPGPNVQSQHIQLWHGQVWHPFFPEVQFTGQVFDLQVHQGVLYVSGIYHFVDDPGISYGILRYDGNQICAIGGPMEADNARMAFFQGDLYLGLAPTYPGPLNHQGIAKLPLEGLVPDRCVTVSMAGITEKEGFETLRLYPNPATNVLTVQTSFSGINAIEILNALGQVVLRQPLQNGSASLDVVALPQASYIVRALGPTVSTYARFIKQ